MHLCLHCNLVRGAQRGRALLAPPPASGPLISKLRSSEAPQTFPGLNGLQEQNTKSYNPGASPSKSVEVRALAQRWPQALWWY